MKSSFLFRKHFQQILNFILIVMHKPRSDSSRYELEKSRQIASKVNKLERRAFRQLFAFNGALTMK